MKPSPAISNSETDTPPSPTPPLSDDAPPDNATNTTTDDTLPSTVPKAAQKSPPQAPQHPTKIVPKCVQCESLESFMWRVLDDNSAQHICQTCYEENQHKNEAETSETTGGNNGNNNNNNEEKKLRKSTRTTRYKSNRTPASSAAGGGGGGGTLAASSATNSNNGQQGGGGCAVIVKSVPRGKSRRNIFKKNPTKTPHRTATTTSVESVFYNVSIFSFIPLYVVFIL